jgi:hypothetical protein
MIKSIIRSPSTTDQRADCFAVLVVWGSVDMTTSTVAYDIASTDAYRDQAT